MTASRHPDLDQAATAPSPPAGGRATAVDTHIGRRIRLRRAQLGYNQQQIAAALGVTYQQFAKYEHGTNRIAASRLAELASVLGVPVAFFYDDDPRAADGPGGVAQPVPAPDPPDVAELLKAYRSISDPLVRKSILDLATRFSGLQDTLK